VTVCGGASGPVIRQLARDRTFFFRTETERALTLRQITSQGLAELLELLQPLIDVVQLPGQQTLHLPAAFTAPPLLKSEQLGYFPQRQSMELRLFDKSNAVKRFRRIQPKATGCAARPRHQASPLVVPQGVPAQAALRRQFADPKRSLVVHTTLSLHCGADSRVNLFLPPQTESRLTLVRAPRVILLREDC
jgi:hypothetical protein